MPSIDEVHAQIKTLDGFQAFMGRREINELPKILASDEPVKNIVQGFYSGGNGILVATDRRLIFIDKGLLYGLKVEDFPYDKLTSIQYSTGLLLGDITMHTSGNIAKIDNVDKKQARAFAEAVRMRLSAPKAASSPMLNSDSSDDFISKLERLGKLRDSGVLTPEEFSQQKQRILAG